MKQLSKTQIESILSQFPLLDSLLEGQRVSTYSSFAISIWQTWLHRDEFDSEMAKAMSTSSIINKKRISFLSELYPEIYYYSYDEQILKFESKDEYFEFISNILFNREEETLLNIKYKCIINISSEFTDILHLLNTESIKQTIKKIEKFTKLHELSIFNF